jgi:hypothetical protein
MHCDRVTFGHGPAIDDGEPRMTERDRADADDVGVELDEDRRRWSDRVRRSGHAVRHHIDQARDCRRFALRSLVPNERVSTCRDENATGQKADKNGASIATKKIRPP